MFRNILNFSNINQELIQNGLLVPDVSDVLVDY